MLELTAERRAELVALLDDDQRLKADYPKVADYLDTSSRLAGSSDGGFDLRLLHYMTGGESANPYWDIVAPAVTERAGRRHVDGGQPDGSARLAYAQVTLQGAYAYAIPSPETLRWIAGICRDHQLLEVGAGRGYWAHQLALLGVDVVAYDSRPPADRHNVSFPAAPGQPDAWFEVADATGLDWHRVGSDQTLFLCWPPGWDDPMALDTLRQFEAAGGRQLLFVGQPKGGMTGNNAFFDRLMANWRLSERDDAFVSWWNLKDVAECWRLAG
ncbi:class I SAM-dependent methyltransferase [Fodinicola acaciae]|uniref:class I SAM-dependent methyltransferase n=1 Tax=Fodinicola acaciae TaxID=2681555 RepID=UPI001C9E4F19|nr:class I SAM-dependent methyltransferase [Fodinicola acaciae]